MLAARDDGEPKGPLSIGSMETTAAVRLPTLLAEFHRRYPAVRLTLRTAPSADLVAAVRKVGYSKTSGRRAAIREATAATEQEIQRIQPQMAYLKILREVLPEGGRHYLGPRWAVIRAQLVMARDLVARSLSFQVCFLSAAAVAARFGVAAVAARLPRIVDQLVDQDVSAGDITRLVTAVGDAVERRLLTLAEAELVAEGHGPPPDYCWMVLGSKARHEQALGSDQDHAVIIADDAPEGAEDWVAALAERVVAGLEAAGYPRCDGDVMATNPRWRMRLAGWRREFQQWIHQPVADAVLTASIFFDSRPLHGNRALHETLDEEVIRRAPDGAVFLAHLAKQAVLNEPPLGFFRGFVLAKAGEHKDTLDLKRGGIGTIVDLARVHALGHGLASVSTRSRLLAAARAGAMSQSMAASLVDALELISHARLQHQARQAAAGVRPDSWVSPTELSPLQQRSLRAAFQTVRRAQQQLAQRYPAQRFS